MNELVFDIETEREFREVGGKQNIHKLGIAVVGVYNYGKDTFYAYEKEELGDMEKLFKSTELIIGFNSRHFDVPVLVPHVSVDISNIPHLDLMDDIERGLGFRVSLENLCRATLGAGKSGNGLEAIGWWRNGEKDKVKEYCLKDVRLTRDLYEFGKKEGFVLCDTRNRGRAKVAVSWKKTSAALKYVAEDEKPGHIQQSLI